MKKQSTAIWASVLLVLTALVLGSLVQYVFYGRSGEEIVLPDGSAADPGPGDQLAMQNKELLQTLTATRDNVLTVLSKLQRPDIYHWESRVTMSGLGSSGQIMVSADTKGTMTRASVRRVGIRDTEEYLLTDLRYYAWEAGDDLVYNGKREDFTGDEVMMSLAYEELLAFPVDSILEVNILQGDRDALLVTAQDPVTGYLLDYRIGVEDGMLQSLTARSGDREVYRIDRLILEVGVLRTGAFDLPDGTVPESSQQ